MKSYLIRYIISDHEKNNFALNIDKHTNLLSHAKLYVTEGEANLDLSDYLDAFDINQIYPVKITIELME